MELAAKRLHDGTQETVLALHSDDESLQLAKIPWISLSPLHLPCICSILSEACQENHSEPRDSAGISRKEDSQIILTWIQMIMYGIVCMKITAVRE